LSSKIDKLAPIPLLSALSRRSSGTRQQTQPLAGSPELPHEWRVALALLPREQRLPWLLQRITRRVLADKFAIVDENAPEYTRLARRINQAMLNNPHEVNRLQLLLTDVST